jgi:hypothetical protein
MDGAAEALETPSVLPTAVPHHPRLAYVNRPTVLVAGTGYHCQYFCEKKATRL